jgi:hypothetical protein
MHDTAKMYELWTREPARPARRGGYDPGRAIYLSEAGQCERRTTLRLLRYEQDQPSAALRASWSRGLLWEAYLSLLWHAWHPKRVAKQAYVRTPYGNGKIDVFVNYNAGVQDTHDHIVANYGNGAYPHIVEIKTKEAKAKPYLPTREHMDQCLMYMHFYECIEVDGVKYQGPRPTGEVTYGIVDTNEVLSYPVEYDTERVQYLVDWMSRVQRSVWNRKPLPVPDERAPDAFPCGGAEWHCSYYRHCWGETEQEEPHGD